ncbi:hypothetical protein BCL79_0746 [Stenotrophomonas rhizophila]|uniref:PH domain-containing protein n=1 Tax=Stenotrophomonas rhizophila TaxID=216778 RepID=A0A498CGL5_9GAMM|nr:hypothetical protein [Stenotrophomonas rhizophila]RLK56361.1 hypothetical protein BCL79_0746 [Stenotrophomonas rhizophila]
MSVGTFFLMLVLSACALVALAVGRTLRSRGDRAAFAAEFDQSYFYGNSALALSMARSRIKLRTIRTTKIYLLDDVRAWEKHWHNSKRQGTLTLSVRDADHPVWTIQFASENDLNRWYEILNQAINDRAML